MVTSNVDAVYDSHVGNHARYHSYVNIIHAIKHMNRDPSRPIRVIFDRFLSKLFYHAMVKDRCDRGKLINRIL